MPDPLIIIEHDRSGDFTVDDHDAGSDRIYKVWRTDDEVAVRLLVAQTAPLTNAFGQLRMGGNFQNKGNGVWEATIKYAVGQLAVGKETSIDQSIGPETTFDTTGGTAKITQSLKTAHEAKAKDDTRDIPDTKNAIGSSAHGVEGTEIIVPKFSWTETWRFPATAITWDYVLRLRDMTGSVSMDGWRTFNENEVLFAGATGAPDGPDFFKVTYHFHAEKNRSGDPNPEALANPEEDDTGSIVITEGFEPIEKAGFDYLWVGYETVASATAKQSVPLFAKTEIVYRRKDFTLLGLGN